MARRIAFVGLGQMGSNMVERLIEQGEDVRGFDISPETRKRLAEHQVPVADSLKEALAGRDIIMTSLPDPNAAKAAYLGPGGIIETADAGSLVMDLSTIDPGTMREIGAAAAKKGLAVVDSPVSGGPPESRKGQLILMVGCDEAVLPRVEPVLNHLSASWAHTGPVGTGKVVKLVNNLMSMGAIALAAEAFALGTAAGVEPQRLFDVLSTSGGRSHQFLKRIPYAMKGDYTPYFKLELGEKDLALAVDLGRALHQPTPSASTIREVFSMGLSSGYRGQDCVALYRMFETWTGR